MAGEAQRGFSLVEITVAVAIIAVVVASSVAFALASRPTALWAATTQFDSMLSAARSIGAAYGDGATIFVSVSPGPSNFRADLYAHRPSATASASPIPSQVQPIIAQVAISESQLLGPPPFAVIVHGNGDIGVRKNYSRGDPVTDAELPCPASNHFIFVFTVNGETATRTLNCHTPLAYTGNATQIPAPGGGPTPTPWAMPSCDPTDNGCPIPPGSPATPAACPAGTTLYNGVCRAPLVLTVNGPTATAGECAWTLSLSPCAFTVSEQFYPAPNLFTAVSTIASPCTANYTISSGSGSGSLVAPNSYTGSSPTTWTVAPQVLDGSSCTVVVYDDRGPSDPNGSATLQIAASTAQCPPGFTGSPPNCYYTQSPPPTAPPLDCTQSVNNSNPQCYLIVLSQGTWTFDCGGTCGTEEGETLYSTIGITQNGETLSNPGTTFACPLSSLILVNNPYSSEVTNGILDYGPVPIPTISTGGGYNYDGPQLQIDACPGWIAQIAPTPAPTDPDGSQPPNNGN